MNVGGGPGAGADVGVAKIWFLLATHVDCIIKARANNKMSKFESEPLLQESRRRWKQLEVPEASVKLASKDHLSSSIANTRYIHTGC